MGYNADLRLAAVRRYLESGDTYAETGKIFGADGSSAQRWVRQYKETGDLSDKPLRRGFKKIDPAKLRDYAKDRPDATQQEIADEFGCPNQAVGKALKRPAITRKKKRAAAKSGTKRTQRRVGKHRSLLPKKSSVTRTNRALTPFTTGNTAALRAGKRFSERFPE